jgi:hypothetical protein
MYWNVLAKIFAVVLRLMTSYTLIGGYECFREMHYLHLQIYKFLWYVCTAPSPQTKLGQVERNSAWMVQNNFREREANEHLKNNCK